MGFRTSEFDVIRQTRSRSESGEVMPLILTLVPIRWRRHAGTWEEPIAYIVEGLPATENAVISVRSGGWRVVRYARVEFDEGKLYPSAEEAVAALRAWIEGSEKPPKAEE